MHPAPDDATPPPARASQSRLVLGRLCRAARVLLDLDGGAGPGLASRSPRRRAPLHRAMPEIDFAYYAALARRGG